jgi:CRISPR/Cas system CSM-associated protein Csm3 (group 7 of RAMP superfamily)
MTNYDVEGRAGRKITERVQIEGTLVLETPAHLGNGDADALTDMPLLLDRVTGKPLLTGTSIAGALRAYLREVEHGYGVIERPYDRAQQLFGYVRKIPDRVSGSESIQSWLLVDDALGTTPGVEIRDGVSLDAATRTAEDKKKYDIELLQAGTTFDISLGLLISEDNQGADLLQSLALVLHGLEAGEIGLGMRKHRGLGQCSVTEWRVRRYPVTTKQGLLAWLDADPGNEQGGAKIYALLNLEPAIADARECFTLDATFALENSLLIRSGSGAPDGPDMAHLQSYRDGEAVPILSGTSLAGVVRARAQRIANTLLPEVDAKALVNGMFGKDIEHAADKPTGSRVITHETEVRGNLDLVQSRVKIDRFTGGAYPQALFSEQPLFGGPESEVRVKLELRSPKPAEIGLLLLVLKDLWTGDLPLGGESSVGRGWLTGREATLTHRKPGQAITWELVQEEGGTLQFGGDGMPEDLEDFVAAFHAYKEGQDA